MQIAIVAAGKEILRSIGIGEAEALHVEIELEHLGRLARETAHGDPDRFGVARFIEFCDFNLLHSAGCRANRKYKEHHPKSVGASK